MIIMNPRADYGSHEVNVISLDEERKKREEHKSPPPQRDYGDETDTTLKSYNDGTRGKV